MSRGNRFIVVFMGDGGWGSFYSIVGSKGSRVVSFDINDLSFYFGNNVVINRYLYL